MKLTVWTYEGPPHVGAMRVVTGLEDVHYVLHAPQGDTYADLLFTMIERREARPPVTYTTFQARDLGGDTAQLFQDAVREAYERFEPAAMLVGASCTAELIQDDPGGLSEALDLPVPVVPVELPAYQRKENWGAAETFYQLVRSLAGAYAPPPTWSRPPIGENGPPTCNLLGPTALGFRHRDDVREVTELLRLLGVEVRTTAPLGARAVDLAALGEADFNVVLYPETGATAAGWLKRTFKQPIVDTVPLGVGATTDFVREVAELVDTDPAPALAEVSRRTRMPWWSTSVDSNYLTGKRVFVFGDATHAVAAARIARNEMGFEVVGIGTYVREFAREVRAVARELGLEALITDDYLEVEAAIEETAPELVLGTQMERHTAKRLGIGCAVISAPVHVQDFPARYAPQMGPEGANVIFDSWIHPLVMGLEDHLLRMFQDDFEFGNGAMPSHLRAEEPQGHLPGHATADRVNGARSATTATPATDGADAMHATDATRAGVDRPDPSSRGVGTEEARRAAGEDDGVPDGGPTWSDEAKDELRKIPFFVRGKARRNTERYASDHGIAVVSLETLYEAKAHFSGR